RSSRRRDPPRWPRRRGGPPPFLRPRFPLRPRYRSRSARPRSAWRFASLRTACHRSGRRAKSGRSVAGALRRARARPPAQDAAARLRRQLERMAVNESRSLEVAEAARQAWERHSFLRDLFLGEFRLDQIHPFPEPLEEREKFVTFYREMERFLREELDPASIDRSGTYPQPVIDALRKMGAFGMKIPEKYGGLGFTQREYSKVMELLGSVDGNVTALLSAHQSIGVPQPVALFGTEEQK